ncbi:molybdopterin biosynthesis protein [Fusibacter ferrireducens]|uniref:Molybdopterin molybdenumtransferase n=1 Tax=Fusibacter ferrireducens TaxID=2785058 RepID=A0ABR9ZTL8_9FIRM|nr:molybdopterin biosynthesis protein [Fusibacter ferrireducens]MBF4692914.1 molybdopterin biosynthesis protein [Fusibacter ferrireducens]
MAQRNVYISNMPLDEALKKYREHLENPLQSESVPVKSTLHRITFGPVFAHRSSPSDPCSAMDGIAVLSERTQGANEKNPMQLKEHEDFEYVNTGNLLPENKDSVIMIEDVKPVSEGVIEIVEAAYSWQHVRQVGEDIIVGEMLLPSFHKVRPMDLGALISGGVSSVDVFEKLKVGILPTGNEIVQDLDALTRGKIIDSNSSVIEGLLTEMGCLTKVYSPCHDDPNALKEAIERGLGENHMLITIAGSSAGEKDYTVSTIEALGEVVVHGVAIKPGKPTILGKIKGKSVVGLPGYPVSAFFAFEAFVKPLIESWHGQMDEMSIHEGVLTQRVVSSLKHEELVRVTLGEVNGKWVVTPLNRGAGTTMSLVKADGVLTIPRLSEGIERGESVEVKLLKPLHTLSERLVVIGSHDLLLDIVADRMPMTSTHVGSLGGVMALIKDECHMAPIHLIDEKTGIYNISTVQRFFPNRKMALIKGVKRLQGLMVRKGNPKGIYTFQDLARKEIEFINRQKGAGTRQLLDYELSKLGISGGDINGYHREVVTHMAVAVAVASEGADAGLGVYSAANSMGLDFIEVGYESYDFLVPYALLEDFRVQRFIDLIKSPYFKTQMTEIGGYALEETGDIIEIGETYD